MKTQEKYANLRFREQKYTNGDEEVAKIADDSAMKRVYDMLREKFREQPEFTTQEVYKALSDMKKSTLSWYLHMLVQKNYIRNLRHGVYGFCEQNDTACLEHMQKDSRDIYDLMTGSGMGFYLSGWDGLLSVEEELPGEYPVILVADKECIFDVIPFLMERGYRVYHDSKEKVLGGDCPDGRKVLLMRGGNMDFGEFGIACLEKGFADLYYAVTRMGYPTTSERLAKMHLDLLNQGSLSVARLKDAGRELGIKTEFEFMLQMSLLPEGAANFFIHGLMSERA